MVRKVLRLTAFNNRTRAAQLSAGSKRFQKEMEQKVRVCLVYPLESAKASKTVFRSRISCGVSCWKALAEILQPRNSLVFKSTFSPVSTDFSWKKQVNNHQLQLTQWRKSSCLPISIKYLWKLHLWLKDKLLCVSYE